MSLTSNRPTSWQARIRGYISPRVKARLAELNTSGLGPTVDDALDVTRRVCGELANTITAIFNEMCVPYTQRSAYLLQMGREIYYAWRKENIIL